MVQVKEQGESDTPQATRRWVCQKGQPLEVMELPNSQSKDSHSGIRGMVGTEVPNRGLAATLIPKLARVSNQSMTEQGNELYNQSQRY